MNVYLVVGLITPTKKQQEEGEVPKIVFQPQAVVSKDEQQAILKAQRFLPGDFEGKEDRLEIRVLPFRGCA